MNNDLLVVLALLAAAIVMFIANRPRMDVVGLLMIVLLPFSGVLTVNEALDGFADPVVDMEMLTLTYDSLDTFLAELRQSGSQCV